MNGNQPHLQSTVRGKMIGVANSLVRKVRTIGIRGASPIDLIAIGFSRTEEHANEAESLGRDMLTRYRSIQHLGDASPDDLHEVTGLDEFEAVRCLALIELGRRSGIAGKGEIEEIKDANDVFQLFDYLRREKKEHFCAIFLDTRNQILKSTVIHIGTLNMSLVGLREVFREAIREGASSMIVAHNHPSGDPTPSPEDLDITKRLVEAGELLDIPVLDHVIIGESRYHSLFDSKQM